MYGIRVFLAGSTKQSAQRARNNIRIMLSRLQNRLCDLCQVPIALYVYDCKDFESRQEEYNKFIQDRTDIFIALVDGQYDPKDLAETEDGKPQQKTYAEFKLACDSFMEKGKPEVILLYKTYKERQKPTKRWRTELDGIGKYALTDTTYANLNRQLETELDKTIHKLIPDTPKLAKAAPAKYKIGDVYESCGVKGIVFSINDDGKSGKILSIRPSIISSWKDFARKKNPLTQPWRTPEIQELEDIFLNKDTFQKISKTLKNLKEATCLEHDRYRESYLSSTPHKAFRQKTVRWSYGKDIFSSTDCETSYVGIIRPVAEVDF